MGYKKAKLALELKDERLSPNDRFILLLYAIDCKYNSKTGKESNTCSPGDKLLAKQSGFSIRGIIDIRTRLIEYGYVQEVSKGSKATKKNSTYQINLF